MSDAEHLIENAIMALERYPYKEAERYFMEAPINIMMSKDSGCPLNAVWEMAIYCDTTLRQYWKDEWEKEAERWIPVTERLPDIAGMSVLVVAVNSYGQKEVVQAFTNYSCPVEFETNVKDYEMIWKTAWKVTHWMPLPEEPKEGVENV